MPARKYNDTSGRTLIDELFRRVSHLERRVEDLEKELWRKNTPGVWIEPVWENGYAQVSDPALEPFAYRIYSGGFPEFKGCLDISGATSGTVAFTLPLGPGEIEIAGDVYETCIVTDGVDFFQAMFHISATTGEVSFYW